MCLLVVPSVVEVRALQTVAILSHHMHKCLELGEPEIYRRDLKIYFLEIGAALHNCRSELQSLVDARKAALFQSCPEALESVSSDCDSSDCIFSSSDTGRYLSHEWLFHCMLRASSDLGSERTQTRTLTAATHANVLNGDR